MLWQRLRRQHKLAAAVVADGHGLLDALDGERGSEARSPGHGGVAVFAKQRSATVAGQVNNNSSCEPEHAGGHLHEAPFQLPVLSGFVPKCATESDSLRKYCDDE